MIWFYKWHVERALFVLAAYEREHREDPRIPEGVLLDRMNLGNGWRWTHASLYDLTARMERDGLIVSGTAGWKGVLGYVNYRTFARRLEPEQQ